MCATVSRGRELWHSKPSDLHNAAVPARVDRANARGAEAARSKQSEAAPDLTLGVGAAAVAMPEPAGPVGAVAAMLERAPPVAAAVAMPELAGPVGAAVAMPERAPRAGTA